LPFAPPHDFLAPHQVKSVPAFFFAALAMAGVSFVSCDRSGSGIPAKKDAPASVTEPDILPVNTTAAGAQPPPAEQVAAGMKLPDGFKAQVFAAEPMVRQPIDMKFDARGRLWVAEAYSYGEWSRRGQDRIVILTDRDGDGKADERNVFASGLHHLTSLEIAPGGVYALDLPEMVFLSDKDGDDRADGREVKLTGFTLNARHNNANGLQWGPDGWLYGRHGAMAAAGKIMASTGSAANLNSGVWRWHPVTETIQGYAWGMVNPWGFDWNESGDFFVSNNVSGHLLHALRGATYQSVRDFGGPVPRLGMIGAAPHYPGSPQNWNADHRARFANLNAADEFGGGHSHCGLLICQGDMFPDSHRGVVLMANTHGQRINQDTLDPLAAAPGLYTSKRTGDLVKPAPGSWFRGVSLLEGPDGSLFVSDWCDDGECHDDDGVHRTSGRIYRIGFGDAKPERNTADLTKLSHDDIVRNLLARSEYLVRQSTRELVRRTSLLREPLSPGADQRLRSIMTDHADPLRRLRAFWALHILNVLTENERLDAMSSEHDILRAWGVALWADGAVPQHVPPPAALAGMRKMAAADTSLRVALRLAGSLESLPQPERWPIAAELLQRSNLKDESTWPVYLWQCTSRACPPSAADAARIAESVKLPALRTLIMQAMAQPAGSPGDLAAQLSALAQAAKDTDNFEAAGIIASMAEPIVSGKSRTRLPPELLAPLLPFLKHSEPGVRGDAMQILLSMEHNEARLAAHAVIDDRSLPQADRGNALEWLCRWIAWEFQDTVIKAFRDPDLRLTAIRLLRTKEGAAVPRVLVDNFPSFTPVEKDAAMEVLCARRNYVKDLRAAIAGGLLPADVIKPAFSRQIAAVMGETPAAADPAARSQTLERLRELAANSAGRGNPERGRIDFNEHCASCHKLFGKGGDAGPDLTGGARKDPGYVLLHVIDAALAVQPAFRLTTLVTSGGNTFHGLAGETDARGATLRLLSGPMFFPASVVSSMHTSEESFMPAGLLEGWPDDRVLDLLAFLAADAP
jgi:putative membrane-bound dehydrogenase-like protein